MQAEIKTLLLDKNELEKRVEQLTKAKAHYKAGFTLLLFLKKNDGSINNLLSSVVYRVDFTDLYFHIQERGFILRKITYKMALENSSKNLIMTF